MNNLKTLLVDIETSPLVGYAWSIYETDIIEVIEDWHLLAFSYKWLGDSKTVGRILPDYKLYKKDPTNDRELCVELSKLFDEAEIIVGQNSDSFDIKKINTRLVYHGLVPPLPYKTSDTLKLAKKYFAFTSNKLNYLCKFLGIGEKADTGGFKLWKGCMAGDMKSWELMRQYNMTDIDLTEELFLKLRPWTPTRVTTPEEEVLCDLCGAETKPRGWRYTEFYKSRQYRCINKTCGHTSLGKREKRSPI